MTNDIMCLPPSVTGENITHNDNCDFNHPTCLQASLEMKAYLREETTEESLFSLYKKKAFYYDPLLCKVFTIRIVYYNHHDSETLTVTQAYQLQDKGKVK